MGRPLKIKKIIETAGLGKDIGFNAFDQLTNPVLPTGGAFNTDNYLGVVGGVQPPTVATAAYPVVKCRVNITNSFTGEDDGVIIRQKGARKFLVATVTAIDPADAVVGVALRIATVGDTEWASMGAPAGYGVGTIFTPVVASAPATSGTAQEVGVCVLTSDLTPPAGDMSISYFSGATDSTEQAISKLTNKFLQNFDGGGTGGSANTGDVWAASATINNVALADNFFSDEGTVAKSGAETDTWGTNGSEQNAGGTLDLGIVENYTS